MKKWGVRLIGVFFLIAAAYNVISAVENYSLLTADTPTPDFWGFDLVYAIVYLYPGIQLLRFHPSGRGCALNVLWLLVLLSGILLVVFASAVYRHYTGEIDFGGPKWVAENLRPIAIILTPVGLLFFFLVPINFLLGEDVERLFGKSVAPKEVIPETKDSSP